MGIYVNIDFKYFSVLRKLVNKNIQNQLNLF